MHVGPVIAVTDLSRARTFYEQQLGLHGEDTPGGRVLHADQSTRIYLLANVADAGSASWPVASFRVDDLRATVGLLRERGVAFLGREDLPFELDDEGISTDTPGIEVAWLRDPDGSVLTIFAET